MRVCPQCQSDRLVNNGSAAGKPLTTKINAVLLYLSGISMNRSKSKEMVDLTMALFARFWVNGNQDDLYHYLVETLKC